MDVDLYTPASVARDVISRRHEINECIRNGYTTDACSELNVHKCQAMDAFVQENPDHGDLLLYVSEKLASHDMDGTHPVAFRVHPVTKDRVYATAQDFADVKPIERDTYEHLVVAKQSVWNNMSPENRAECLSKGNVVLTNIPNNETLRAAGCRYAVLAETADFVAQDNASETVESGPVAFLKAIQVHWHEGHYCLNDNANSDRLKSMIQTVCKQRGIKAGVLVVPTGHCSDTVRGDELDSLVTKIFPNTMKSSDIESIRAQLDIAENYTPPNFIAHFPTSTMTSGVFEPIPLLSLEVGNHNWTTKNTQISYDNKSQTWLLRRTVNNK